MSYLDMQYIIKVLVMPSTRSIVLCGDMVILEEKRMWRTKSTFLHSTSLNKDSDLTLLKIYQISYSDSYRCCGGKHVSFSLYRP